VERRGCLVLLVIWILRRGRFTVEKKEMERDEDTWGKVFRSRIHGRDDRRGDRRKDGLFRSPHVESE